MIELQKEGKFYIDEENENVQTEENKAVELNSHVEEDSLNITMSSVYKVKYNI